MEQQCDVGVAAGFFFQLVLCVFCGCGGMHGLWRLKNARGRRKRLGSGMFYNMG